MQLLSTLSFSLEFFILTLFHVLRCPFTNKFNSEANEQVNNQLQRVKTQVHFMNSTNALEYLKQFFGALNLRRREALKANRDLLNHLPAPREVVEGIALLQP